MTECKELSAKGGIIHFEKQAGFSRPTLVT